MDSEVRYCINKMTQGKRMKKEKGEKNYKLMGKLEIRILSYPQKITQKEK